MRRSLLTVLLVVAGVLLVTEQVIRATTVPDVPAGLTELVANAEGLQKTILEDGVVTTAELENAIRAAVTCMENVGLQVSLDLDLDDNAWAVRFNGGPTEESLAQAQQLVDQCEAEHLQLVSSVYSYQEQPTDEEFLAAFAEIANCLRSRGVEVRDNSVEAVAEATAVDSAAYIECSRDL